MHAGLDRCTTGLHHHQAAGDAVGLQLFGAWHAQPQAQPACHVRLFLRVGTGRRLDQLAIVKPAQLGVDGLRLPLADDAQLHRATRCAQPHQRGQVARGHDGLAVEVGDHVARFQARLGGGATFLHQRAFGFGQLERVGQRLIDLLYRHAQARVLDLAGLDDLLLNAGRQLNRNGKGHALITARAAVDLRVDAHHLATRVEQRAARVAGVHRHVGLQERHKGFIGQRAALGADHASSHRVLKAKGRANGQHPLAHFQLLAAAQLDDRQILGLDLQHRDVGLGVRAQHLGLELAAVGQLDVDVVGAAHHVGIGQDQAIGADDEARALARRRHLGLVAMAPTPAGHARHAKLPHELAQLRRQVLLRCGRFVIARIGHPLGAAHADVDHGWAVLPRDGGEAGQSLRGGGRRRRLRRSAGHLLALGLGRCGQVHAVDGGGAQATQHASHHQGQHQLLAAQRVV